MLSEITPVILTFNEAPNIKRTLERLSWANEVVVVDSYSDDETLPILQSFPNVHVHQYRYDTHVNKWTFAISKTGITTPWVLALDADYILTNEFIKELSALELASDVTGYRAGFIYCIYGRPLRGSLYPPATVLFRREGGRYVEDGHTQRLEIDGHIAQLKGRILHDDRKTLSRWLQMQDHYIGLEADHISSLHWKSLNGADKLRRFIVIAPILVFIYCMIVRRGVFDGKAGLHYALQRTLAEALLSLRLLEKKLK